MAGKKTQDGLNVWGAVKTVLEKPRMTYREGRNHAYILNYPGLRPCPMATSTHVGRMVAPWVAQATGMKKQEVYRALRQGHW